MCFRTLSSDVLFSLLNNPCCDSRLDCKYHIIFFLHIKQTKGFSFPNLTAFTLLNQFTPFVFFNKICFTIFFHPSYLLPEFFLPTLPTHLIPNFLSVTSLVIVLQAEILTRHLIITKLSMNIRQFF